MRIPVSVIAFLGALHLSCGEELRLLNLDPPEAQQYIDKQDTSLKYAPKVDSNVPAVRFLGNEPHNVLEDIYLANQYHGQDGIGGYLYGYSVPDIAKTEKKKAGGDLRGAYNYIAGNGQEIKVEYWDDGTGFHQVDNVPKILPKQIDDTPEVKAAKEEHQRIWNEQAERNSRPIQNPYDSHFNYAQGTPQSQAQQLVSQYQQQKQQFPNPGQSVHYQGDQSGQYQGQSSQNLNRYQPGGQLSGAGSQGGAQFGSRPSGSGQYGGGQSGSGQYGGGQTGSGKYGGGQTGSGQYGGGQSGSGQFGGGQSGSGQYGGGQSSGSSSFSGAGQSSGSGQYGGQSSSGGQFGASSGSGSGQYGAGQASGGGQFGGSRPTGAGQYGGSQTSGGGQFGSGQPSGGGQYGGSHSAGGGQYGGSQSSSTGGQFGAGQSSGGGQYGGSHSSGGGQFGAGQSSGGGLYGGSQSSSGGQFGAGQASGSGQYGGSHSSGSGQFGAGQSSGSGQYGSGQSSGGGIYGGSQSSGGGQYGASGQYGGKYSGDQSEGKWNEEEEEKGPPKGFFYSFDYPVGIIVQKDGGSIQKREGDLKDIYTANKANFEQQLQQGHADRSSRSATGYLVV